MYDSETYIAYLLCTHFNYPVTQVVHCEMQANMAPLDRPVLLLHPVVWLCSNFARHEHG